MTVESVMQAVGLAGAFMIIPAMIVIVGTGRTSPHRLAASLLAVLAGVLVAVTVPWCPPDRRFFFLSYGLLVATLGGGHVCLHVKGRRSEAGRRDLD